jgi:hypothetical protein
MKTLYIIIVFILIQGCNSGPSYTLINYTFIDYYSSKPLMKFKVNITKGENEPQFILDSIVTDSNGRASHLVEDDSHYSRFVSPNQNSTYSKFEDVRIINGGKESKILKLKPWNQMIISLKNISNKYDSINIILKTLKLGGTGNYIGKFSDTTITFSHSVPEENVTISYKLYKNNINAIPILTLDTTFLTSKDEQNFMTIQK